MKHQTKRRDVMNRSDRLPPEWREKMQAYQNKMVAMQQKVVRAQPAVQQDGPIPFLLQREQQEQIASTRKSQVGSGDRSEKIRTYNYPQSRVTDHRINKTLYSLDAFLNGDIDGIVDELIAADTAERLKGEQNEY